MKIPLVKTITEGLGLAAGHEAAGVGANALQKGLEQLNEAVLPSVKPKLPPMSELKFQYKSKGEGWQSFHYKHPSGEYSFEFSNEGLPSSVTTPDNGYWHDQVDPSHFEAVKAEHNVGKIDPFEQVPWTPKDYYFTEKDEFPDASAPESGMINPLAEGLTLKEFNEYPKEKIAVAHYHNNSGDVFFNYDSETGKSTGASFIDKNFKATLYYPDEIPTPDLASIKKVWNEQGQKGVESNILDPTAGHIPTKEEPGVLTYVINEEGKEHEAGKWVLEYDNLNQPSIAYFYPKNGSEVQVFYPNKVKFPKYTSEDSSVSEPSFAQPIQEEVSLEYAPIPPEEAHPVDAATKERLMKLSREESDETHIGFEPSLHEGVSPAQDKTVKAYTTSSRNTNRYAAGRSDIDYAIGSEGWLRLVKRTNDLDTLTERSLPYDTLLFRFIEPSLWSDFKKTPVGAEFTHRAFASTSFRKQEAMSHSNGGLLIIIAPKGTKGFVTGPMASSSYWNEQEVILKRATRFKVIAKEGRELTVEALPPEPSNWRRPPEESLKHEYDVEYNLHFKPSHGDIFPTFDSFKEAIEKAPIADITKTGDRHIAGRSRTESVDSLLSLIKSYKSYPKFRNEETLNALSERIKTGRSIDMPIVIRRKHGQLQILSGNTRMDLAFIHGADRVPVILLEIP